MGTSSYFVDEWDILGVTYRKDFSDEVSESSQKSNLSFCINELCTFNSWDSPVFIKY